MVINSLFVVLLFKELLGLKWVRRFLAFREFTDFKNRVCSGTRKYEKLG